MTACQLLCGEVCVSMRDRSIRVLTSLFFCFLPFNCTDQIDCWLLFHCCAVVLCMFCLSYVLFLWVYVMGPYQNQGVTYQVYPDKYKLHNHSIPGTHAHLFKWLRCIGRLVIFTCYPVYFVNLVCFELTSSWRFYIYFRSLNMTPCCYCETLISIESYPPI